MKIKVCGMCDPHNVAELVGLPIDIIGFIFYDKSGRFVGENFDVSIRNLLPQNISAAGVFVNQTIEHILETQQKYSLQYLQIHGNESPQFCENLRKQTSAKIIKAFQIDDTFDFRLLQLYIDFCDYFLFDTKSSNYGGTGKQFDWDLLKKYTLKTPIFLSGGIGPDDFNKITAIDFLPIYCIDLNSKFEILPGIKNVSAISNFISKI